MSYTQEELSTRLVTVEQELVRLVNQKEGSMLPKTESNPNAIECPFCHSSHVMAELEQIGAFSDARVYVACKGCGARGPEVVVARAVVKDVTEDNTLTIRRAVVEACQKWNKRSLVEQTDVSLREIGDGLSEE